MDNDSRSDYKQVQILSILPNQVLSFDLYIYLPINNKFIKYVSAGEIMNDQQLQQLKFKKTLFLYTHISDIEKYNSYIKSNIRKLLNKDDKKEKVLAIKAAANLLLNSLNSMSLEGDVISWNNNCVEITKSIIEEVTKSNISLAYKAVLDFLSDAPTLSSHSLMVSSLGLVFAMSLGNYSSKTFSEVAYGGLVHDIGLGVLPVEISNKYLTNVSMTADEFEILKTHPRRGIELIQPIIKSKVITDNVMNIILDHHETMSGTGYPRGISWNQLSYTSKIISIADVVSLELNKNRSGEIDLKYILFDMIKNQELNQSPVLDKRMLKMILETF